MKMNGLYLCFYLLFSITTQVFSVTPVKAKETASQNLSSTPLNEIDFDHLEETSLYFKTETGKNPPKPLKTGIFDLTYIGALKPSEDKDKTPPYFLFSGKTCQNCLEDRTIYAIPPAGGKLTAFVYPGKIFEPKTRALLVDSRAFFGRCLAHKGDVYVVFQKEKVDRKPRLQESVLVIEPGQTYLQENLLEKHLPKLHSTLQWVKKKFCHEIEGRNRVMLSKPINLHPKNGSDSGGDDDDVDDSSPTS